MAAQADKAPEKGTESTHKAIGGRRRRLVGTVTSNKMNKTVVVQVSRRVRDAKFHKFLTKRVKYKAHDERNEYKIGDRVEIIETAPISKDKRWRVTKLLERPAEV